MDTLPLLRFIPFRVADIVAMCLAEGRLDAAGQERFEAAREQMESGFREQFHQFRQQLKGAYGPLDPDADTRLVAEFRDPTASARLTASR